MVWKLCETDQVEGNGSALTVTKLVYVMRKELDPGQMEDVLKKLMLIFHFAELSAAEKHKSP